MSGIARVLHDRGIAVSGSDLRRSRYSDALVAAGVPVSIGHDPSNLGDPEIVVVSTAIPESNPELQAARARNIPVWPRARMLAELAGDRLTLAVAGTHGKTSTSSMAATALASAGEDPTFLIGGEISAIGSNARCGQGRYYVVEADESDGTFLLLDPYCAIVTNVEADHLDHYGSFEKIVDAFRAFIARVRPDGVAVLCADNESLRRLAASAPVRVVTYGHADDADVRLVSYTANADGSTFTVRFPDGREVEASLVTPGEHMALNATGVLAAAYALDLDLDAVARGLAAHGGVKRRFEPVGDVGGVRVFDDYAHHPTELRATLTAARQVANGHLWVVFQPHRYSRTEALAGQFGDAFGGVDRLVLLDVYSAGEAPIPGVSGKTVADAVLRRHPRTHLAYFPHRADAAGYIAERTRPGDVVMTMGAGDVTTVGPEIVRALTERNAGGGPS